MLQALLALALLAATVAPQPGATLELAAGTPLRQLASPVAPPVAVLPVAAHVEVLERHGGWLRVGWDDVTGWVDRRPPDDRPETVDDRPETVDDRRLETILDTARNRFGDDLDTRRVGPFHLLTDVADEALLARLDRTARDLPPIFEERYGLRLEADADAVGWTVVLFADAEDHHAFTRHLAQVTGRDPASLDYAAHAVGRLAVLPAGELVERLFLHEAGHLLLRRALGREPPVWLDEGIAGDLEMMPVDGQGRVLSARLDRGTVPKYHLNRRVGPLSRLDDLAEAARRRQLPGVSSLLDMEREELAASPNRQTVYAFATFLVRYLVEGGGRAVNQRFRAYLAGGAEGGLLPALEMDQGELDHGFADWMVALQTKLVQAGQWVR